ncbi:CLUMA_CG018552, isoform A [Clunio marinus]|uniref:CLUMA_CG018552, isoform A n=1 Tax=Clunio marinus TaxID=568069 RepID=A0A1J1IY54_9DIPT|nr:CLUMA_CG018552, isoform A [Clunio marinus]
MLENMLGKKCLLLFQGYFVPKMLSQKAECRLMKEKNLFQPLLFFMNKLSSNDDKDSFHLHCVSSISNIRESKFKTSSKVLKPNGFPKKFHILMTTSLNKIQSDIN